MRRPGRWLRTAAARVCAKQTMERVVDPIVSDINTEHEEAMRSGRVWRAAWIRVSGYTAFWKALGLHTLQSGPRSVWNGIAADGWTLGRLIAYSLAVFVAVTLLLSALPMVDFYSRSQQIVKPTLLLLPQAIPLSIPVALPLAIVCSVYATRVVARRMRGVLILAGAATLLALAAILLVPDANQAFRVLMAEELGSRGVTTFSLPRGMNELTLSELAVGAREYAARGFPETAREFTWTYHIRFALPAGTFVLSLLALGIGGTVRSRAGRVVAMILGFVLYWATLALGERSTSVPAIVSSWAPNILLSAMALALLRIHSARVAVDRPHVTE